MGGSGSRRSRGRIAWALLLSGGLAIGLVGGVWGLRRLWPWLEPARTMPLLPPWPGLSRPGPPAPGANANADADAASPLQGLSPGWRATSFGNPALGPYPQCWQSLPRTPWDLAQVAGRLYVGLGNASNEGPSANAGPVPLLSFHFQQRRWQEEARLPEEEISRFVPRGGALWIPGADARGSWRWGNLYHRAAGGGLWWQLRRLPGLIHVHDLAWHGGQMAAAGNVADGVPRGPADQRHGSALATSADGGRSWRVQRLQGWRSTALLPVAGQLLAVEALPGPALRQWLRRGGREKGFVAVQELVGPGQWQPRPDLERALLLPGVAGAGERFAWLDGATHSGGAVVWIASLGPWRGEPPRRAAFAATSLRRGEAKVWPVPLESGAEAMDLVATPGGWALLSSQPMAPQRWRSRITALTLRQGPWHGQAQFQDRTLLSFEAPLPAWSLAAVGRGWVVGLGPPPFQRETAPRRCSPGDGLSGSIVRLEPGVN